jgi:hypothetical protein
MLSAKTLPQLTRAFLVVGVVLAFAAPPLSFGVKKLFLVDGWITLAAVAGYVLSLNNPRHRASWVLWGGTALLALIYWHGQFRISLKADLDYALAYARDNDGFRPFDLVQDGILWVRCTTWLGAACALCLAAPRAFKTRDESISYLGKLWGWAALIEGVFAMVAFHSPLRRSIGALYGYNTEYIAWANRLYGTFASPIELSAVLAPGALWWFIELTQTRKGERLLPALAFTVTLLSLLHTNTYTALVGFLVALAYLQRRWLLPRWKGFTAVLTAVAVFLTYVAFHAKEWAAQYTWFFNLRFHDKGANLLFRIKPWGIFIASVFSRWDLALLGLGFARSHSDNGFIQVLRAGGLALLLPYLGILIEHCRRLRGASEWAVAVTICIFLGALTTDVLIFRTAGNLFCALVALNLAFPHRPKYR